MRQLSYWTTLCVLGIGLSVTSIGYTTDTPTSALLRDGFHIQAADGSLVLETDTGRWFFQFKKDLFDGKQTVSHQTRYALLPTNVFESLIIDQQKRSTLEYRLWAQVTQHQGRNYLYVTRFLPLRKTAITPIVTPAPARIKPGSVGAKDSLGIPESIERDRRTRRLVERPAPEVAEPSQPDGLMLDRVGYVTITEDPPAFVLDGLGRTINPRPLTLLPNRLLDDLQQQQAAALGRIHFKIVALMTEYQEQEHLLLLRATRVYHYGNFGK